MYLDKDNILDISKLINENPSFQKIMKDGTITEEELATQTEKVSLTLTGLKEKLDADQMEEVYRLLIDTSVLVVLHNYYSLQQ